MSRILVIDEVWPLTGMVETYRDAYLADYAPAARRRGMTLEAVLLTPPLVLAEGGNRLTFVWSIPDASGFWPVRFADEDTKHAWWDRSAAMTHRQERTLHTDFAGDDHGHR